MMRRLEAPFDPTLPLANVQRYHPHYSTWMVTQLAGLWTLLAAKQTGNEHFDQDRSSQLPMIAGTTMFVATREPRVDQHAQPR